MNQFVHGIDPFINIAFKYKVEHEKTDQRRNGENNEERFPVRMIVKTNSRNS